MRHRRLLPTALASLFVALVGCSQQAPPEETTLAPTVSTTIERRVVAKTDDAEELVSSGAIDLSSSDLELILEGNKQQAVGVRFTNLNIPQGATITKAYVQFSVDETRNDAGTLVIKAQAADNAPTFAATAADISSRPTTGASVSWTPAPWTTVGAAGPEQQTPNLKAVVQAVVNRGGWTSGNALAFVITGSGRRVAESFNGSPANAPLLHVEYESDGAPPAIQYTLTVNKVGTGSGTVTGPGINCGSDCSENYNGGTQVTLTAAPASGSSFSGWSGACTGTGTCTVTMNAAKTVNAAFSSSSTPPAGQVTIEKRVATKSDDAEEQSAGNVDLNSSDLELVFDGSRQQTVGIRFANLNIPKGATITSAYVQFIVDEVQNNDGALVVKGQAADNASTFTATANNISSRPTTGASVNWTPAPWTVVGANGPAQRTPDLKAVVQAVVNRGGWTSGNALAFIITGSGKRVAESFNGSPAKAPLLHVEYSTDGTPPPPPSQYALSVNKTGAGSGTVSGPGINCGGDCSETYNSGTQVTLTASPASGSSFAGWSGACSGTSSCTVTMNAAKTVTATFSTDPLPPSQFSLTVNKSGSGSGTVTGPGINCGSDCAETYNSGTQVTLVAAPASGSSFSGWSGACSGTGDCTVTMNAARNVTATFGASSPPPTGQGSIASIAQANVFLTGYSGGTASGSPLTIPSTDPAGIVYHPPSGHLFISDSEINEISSVYSTVQANVFEVSLNGNTLHNKYDLTTTANGKQREPTGIGYCPGDNRFYVSHDNTPNGVWRYGLSNSNVNFEDQVNTPNARDDDPNTKDDPEDVVCDPATGLLYVINGVNLNILVYSYDPNYSEPNPGPSARVATTSFKLERNIDLVSTAGDPSGIPSDTEGIGFDPVSKHLFVTSAPEKTIYEFTTAGRFVKKFNISGFSPAPLTPQGITIGPASNGSGKQSFYIADGGVDNDKDSQERDGRIYEAVITRSQ